MRSPTTGGSSQRLRNSLAATHIQQYERGEYRRYPFERDRGRGASQLRRSPTSPAQTDRIKLRIRRADHVTR